MKEESSDKEAFVYTFKMARPKKQKKPKENPNDWIDLGEWKPERPFTKTVQSIAGHYCDWCSERTSNHHMHYLLARSEDKTEEPQDFE